MRILYGAHTQGLGGLAKAGALIPLLESLGHEVCLVTSGRAAPSVNGFRRHFHFPGMEYVVARGQTDYVQTFLQWAREVPRILRTVWQLKHFCRAFRPELVISDFEPLTAHPLLQPGCEVLAVSRPVALIDPGIPLPEGKGFHRRIVRSVVRLFSAGADRRLGYHIEPATYRCVPPVVGGDIAGLPRENGEHLLVYNVYHTSDGRAAELVAWAARARCPVMAYGFPEVHRRERVGLVEFRPAGRKQFLRDLATCRTVITTAGLSLPIEAFRLGKPVSVVPIPGQWEQSVNAFHFEEAKIARRLPDWDYSAALDNPPADSESVNHWLCRDPLLLLRRLLPADAVPPPTAPRIAA